MVTPPIPSFVTVMLSVLVLGAIIVIARRSPHWTTYPSRVAAFLSGAALRLKKSTA